MSLASLLERIFSWRPGRLAHGTVIVTLGMGTRTVMQAAVFLAIARALQPENYGALCAVLAIAGAVGSLGGLGTSMLVVRDMALDSSLFPETWGRYLAIWAMSTPAICVIYFLIAVCVLPASIPFSVIITIGLSEVGLLPLTAGCGKAFQACGRMTGFSKLMTIPVFFRFAAAMLFLAFPNAIGELQYLEVWCFLYLMAAFGAVLYCVSSVNRHIGRPQLPKKGALKGLITEGFPFAIGGTALRLYADIDKTMVSRIVSLEAAGIYSAGYRFMDMATIPILALINTAMPHFFKIGETSKALGLRYLRRILPIPLIYASVVAMLLYIGAPAVTAVLGASYDNSIASLRWLAWLPLFSAPRYLLQTVLGTSGHQREAVVMICIGAFTNITLNFWMIPIWSWKGAVIATYFAEGIMMLGLSAVAMNESRSKKTIKENYV